MVYSKHFFLLLVGFILIVSSCSNQKKNMLFRTQKKIKSTEPVLILNQTDTVQTVYRHRIKVGDRLAIRFLNNYDIGTGADKSATSGANIESNTSGYLVNYDSTVTLPLLGRLNLVGLTRLEAAAKLETEYSKFIVKPIIDLNIASLGVTILGEVNSPGKIYVDKENTTLIDVIALAGGLRDSGKKHSIKIIRGAEVIVVNLRKIEALQSQALVMHDNDIVYIEPYNVKAASEPFVAMQPITMTTISMVLLITQFYLISQK
jgi:polysaccharide biosynthesis/export protein